MTERSRRVLSEAMELSLDERAELAVELLASLDGEPDVDADAAWAAEIERRARRAVAGVSQGQDWRQACAEIAREKWGK